MSYTQSELTTFINNNPYITECQRKDFLTTTKNIFYVDQKSDRQIITYIDNANESQSFGRIIRLYTLFNHFVTFELTEKILRGVKKHRYPDSKIYKYIVNHLAEQKKKHNVADKHACSMYTYIFENIALAIYQKHLKKEDSANIKYLNVGCGNGHKAKLFGQKLGLPKSNVFGTDIEAWGSLCTK